MRSIPALCAAWLATAACAPGDAVEEHRVRAAVREYDLALPRAYASRDTEAVAGTTTQDERDRIELIIHGVAGPGNMILDARQETYEPLAVRFPQPQAAELEASETWWYRHHDPTTGAIGQAPRRLAYRMRYHLVEQEGRWLVDRLEVLETNALPLE